MKTSNNKPPLKKDQPQKEESEFVCLRHPEVKQNKPGICPKCGTSLRLKNK
jgi:uncharacterized paraquat-inducible protein A